MADETGEDLEKLMEGLGNGDGSIGADGSTGTGLTELDATDLGATTVAERSAGGTGARSRLIGTVALLLGTIGSLFMALLAALVIRVGFTASDTVDRVMEPVEVSFDRLEDRIDQTDDLADREGIASERIDELQARVDGLVDVSTAAHQGFEAIEDHPVYGLLPAELSSLGEDLGAFEASSVEIDRLLGNTSSGSTLSATVAGDIADQLDGMQGRVSDVRDAIDSAATSLRRWIRFGAFLGFLGSLWGLWGQISLAKRGWRGFRGRTS